MDKKTQHTVSCTNCGTPMHGIYCSQCGQKKFSKHELTITHFLQEAIHAFTHFDSKVFKAIFYLFAKPGFLTKEFSLGRVQKHIKPLTLFLLLNAFFFFLGHRIFSIKDADYTYFIEKYPAKQKIFATFKESHNLSEIEVAQKFNVKKEFYQKLIYFIMIPLFGVGLNLIFFNRRKLFIENLVHAIHTFSWYILMLIVVVPLVLVISEVLNISHQQFEKLLIYIILCIAFIYNYLSIKRIFSFKPVLTFIYAIPVTLLLIILDIYFEGWLIFKLTTLHFI